MSKQIKYCKKLLKKAIIIWSNLSKNEKETINIFIDEINEGFNGDTFLVNNKDECKSTNRSDVILMNDKHYCIDCFCIIKN